MAMNTPALTRAPLQSAGDLGHRPSTEDTLVRAIARECRKRGFTPAMPDPSDAAARAEMGRVIAGLVSLHEKARLEGRPHIAAQFNDAIRILLGARVAAWAGTPSDTIASIESAP
jgi:hypothetical protein